MPRSLCSSSKQVGAGMLTIASTLLGSALTLPGACPFVSGACPFVKEGARFRAPFQAVDKSDVEERPDLDKFIPFVFESVFVTIKELQVTIGVIYRTPDSDATSFLT